MADDPKSYKFIKEVIKEDGNGKKPRKLKALKLVLSALAFGLIASAVIALTQPFFADLVAQHTGAGKVDIPGETDAAGSISAQTSSKDASDSSQGTSAEAAGGAKSTSGEAVGGVGDDSTDTEGDAKGTSEGTAGAAGDASGDTDGTAGATEATDAEKLEENKALYHTIYAAADAPKRSVVTVTGIKNQMDYFKQNYESQQQLSGLIAAKNAQDLFILTQYRVVEDVERIQVSMYDESIADAVFLKRDRNTGLAILKVGLASLAESTRAGLAVARFGDSNLLRQGEGILAIGNPNGYSDAVTYGTLTSVTNKIQTIDTEYNLLTTNIIGSTEGSGVLVNLDGEVVGVIAQNFGSQGSNTVVALSVSQIKDLIEQLSNNEQLPYAGITGQNVTAQVSEKTGIPQGVLVTEAEADSPAMMAGIKEFDVIVKFDGVKVSTLNQYHDTLEKCEVGKKVPVVAMRKGAQGYVEVKFEVTIGDR